MSRGTVLYTVHGMSRQDTHPFSSCTGGILAFQFDLIFGLVEPAEEITPKGYAKQWAHRMSEAYQIVESYSRQSSARGKAQYDRKVRGVCAEGRRQSVGQEPWGARRPRKVTVLLGKSCICGEGTSIKQPCVCHISWEQWPWKDQDTPSKPVVTGERPTCRSSSNDTRIHETWKKEKDSETHKQWQYGWQRQWPGQLWLQRVVQEDTG